MGQPQKLSQRKDGDEGGPDAGRNFHGEKRTNRLTNPGPIQARLYKKSYGQEAKLSYLGHTVVEKLQRIDHRRHGNRSQWQGMNARQEA